MTEVHRKGPLIGRGRGNKRKTDPNLRKLHHCSLSTKVRAEGGRKKGNAHVPVRRGRTGYRKKKRKRPKEVGYFILATQEVGPLSFQQRGRKDGDRRSTENVGCYMRKKPRRENDIIEYLTVEGIYISFEEVDHCT